MTTSLGDEPEEMVIFICIIRNNRVLVIDLLFSLTGIAESRHEPGTDQLI